MAVTSHQKIQEIHEMIAVEVKFAGTCQVSMPNLDEAIQISQTPQNLLRVQRPYILLA